MKARLNVEWNSRCLITVYYFGNCQLEQSTKWQNFSRPTFHPIRIENWPLKLMAVWTYLFAFANRVEEFVVYTFFLALSVQCDRLKFSTFIANLSIHTIIIPSLYGPTHTSHVDFGCCVYSLTPCVAHLPHSLGRSNQSRVRCTCFYHHIFCKQRVNIFQNKNLKAFASPNTHEMPMPNTNSILGIYLCTYTMPMSMEVHIEPFQRKFFVKLVDYDYAR